MPRPPPKSSCSSGTPSLSSSRASVAAASAARASGSSSGDLRADVHVDPDRHQPAAAGHVADQAAGHGNRHTELVVAQAGRDVRMALRVDVGIDPQRDAGGHAVRRRQLVEALELARRLDVDGVHVEGHGAGQFGRRLAHPGEDDLARREPAAQRDVDLAHRVGVDPAAERAQQADDGQRGVGLEGVVDGVRVIAEGGVEAGGRRRAPRRRCRRSTACRGRRRRPPRSPTRCESHRNHAAGRARTRLEGPRSYREARPGRDSGTGGRRRSVVF